MAEKILMISYPLDRKTPLYPGTPSVSIEEFYSIAKGRSANSSNIILNSHSGTHIDLPAHFIEDGLQAIDLLDREMILEPSYFLSIPKEEDQQIGPKDLNNIEELDDAEAIFVRTGFGKHRNKNPGAYIERHPWISPELPKVLRKTMPRLQLFGIDALSIAVPSRSKEGRDAHLGFLRTKRPIMIMEDADLSNESLLSGSWRLRIYPWIIDEIEAVPATVLAQRIK